jgi:hypothetical protein
MRARAMLQSHRATNEAGPVRLYVTIDHSTIVDWAQRHGASPSTLDGDEHPWPLLFEFGPSLPPDVIAISWDRFFAQFERDELALAFFDVAPDGKLDDYHQFVKRAALPDLVFSGRSTIVARID